MAEGLAISVVWVLVAVLVAGVIGAAGIAVRRILIARGGGTVECGLRRGPDRNWRLGLAAYLPDQLDWYRAFGVRLRPDEVFDRHVLSVVSRRRAGPAEAVSLGPGTVVVECYAGAELPLVELAMSRDALTGFLAWLEATPPGAMPGLG
ncbi:MAG TPA: DUF2550 domain-containing protein [Streptosporangiaceae bacterium]